MLKLQLGIAGRSLRVRVLEGSKSPVQLDVTSNFPLRRMRAITHLLSEHFAGAGPRLTFFIAVFLSPWL